MCFVGGSPFEERQAERTGRRLAGSPVRRLTAPGLRRGWTRRWRTAKRSWRMARQRWRRARPAWPRVRPRARRPSASWRSAWRSSACTSACCRSAPRAWSRWSMTCRCASERAVQRLWARWCLCDLILGFGGSCREVSGGGPLWPDPGSWSVRWSGANGGAGVLQTCIRSLLMKGCIKTHRLLGVHVVSACQSNLCACSYVVF